MARLNQHPTKRYEGGVFVGWQARLRFPDKKRKALGVYPTKREAQNVMDDEWDRWHGRQTHGAMTVGEYARTWTEKHPRSRRTNEASDHRLSRVLDVRVEGVLFRDMALTEIRPRHIDELVAAMLTQQGRSVSGTRTVLTKLHAFFKDASRDLDGAITNPVSGVTVRQNDPRATKPNRAIPVWSWEQMHGFAYVAGHYPTPPTKRAHHHYSALFHQWRHIYAEPMIRCLADCNLRLGELFGLNREDYDGDYLHVKGSTWNGVFYPGDQPTKKHVRSTPVPPTLAVLLNAIPPRIDTPLLFPTTGGRIWMDRNWRRAVWNPTRQRVAGMASATPHSFRHSWVSLLRAEGLDRADLALYAAHGVATADQHYTHALDRSAEAVRKVIG